LASALGTAMTGEALVLPDIGSSCTGAHFSKFVLRRRTCFYELRKVVGTSEPTILALLWQIYWIDRLNWIHESDFQ
jgi:hypothetical protein